MRHGPWLLGKGIAVARGGTFNEVALEDLLAYDPQHLVGQTVVRRGEEWVVEGIVGSDLVVRQGSETIRAGTREVVDENRAALRARTVILIGKG